MMEVCWKQSCKIESFKNTVLKGVCDEREH